MYTTNHTSGNGQQTMKQAVLKVDNKLKSAACELKSILLYLQTDNYRM
jgi:hypothetical protein